MGLRDAKVLVFSIPVLIFAGILLYLVLWNVYYSFFNWSSFNPRPYFVGLLTYSTVFSNNLFDWALIRTLLWAGGLVACGNALGVLIAGLIYFLRSDRLRTVYTSVFLYPFALPMAAVAMVWVWLFNIKLGINSVLTALHMPTFSWLSVPTTMFPSLFIVTVWVFSGLAALFYLSSFYNVEKAVIESARVDGASSTRIFFQILLPASKNSFIVVTALLLLFSLRIFSLPFAALGGLNPYVQTLTINLYYFYITEYFSESSVVAVIVTIIAAAIVLPYAMYGIKRWIGR